MSALPDSIAHSSPLSSAHRIDAPSTLDRSRAAYGRRRPPRHSVEDEREVAARVVNAPARCPWCAGGRLGSESVGAAVIAVTVVT